MHGIQLGDAASCCERHSSSGCSPLWWSRQEGLPAGQQPGAVRGRALPGSGRHSTVQTRPAGPQFPLPVAPSSPPHPAVALPRPLHQTGTFTTSCVIQAVCNASFACLSHIHSGVTEIKYALKQVRVGIRGVMLTFKAAIPGLALPHHCQHAENASQQSFPPRMPGTQMPSFSIMAMPLPALCVVTTNDTVGANAPLERYSLSLRSIMFCSRVAVARTGVWVCGLTSCPTCASAAAAMRQPEARTAFGCTAGRRAAPKWPEP